MSDMFDIHEARTMAAENAFHAAQGQAAEQAYDSYDFDGILISDAGEWDVETEDDGVTLHSRTLYLETDLHGDGRLTFKVRFPQDSIEPSDIVALSMGAGEEIGSPANTSAPSP